jgi:hypothetical protein
LSLGDAVEGLGQLAGGGEAFVPVFCHGGLDEEVAVGGQVGFEVGDVGHRFGDVFHGDAHGGVGGEGDDASPHAEEEDSEGVYVAAPVYVGVAAGEFGAHVGGGAEDGAAGEFGGAAGEFDNAEVGEVGVVVGVEEDVAGFDVAVDDAFAVGGVEGGGDLAQDARGFGDGECAAAQAVYEGAAGHEAHDVIELFVVFAEVVDGDDGGVFEGGEGFDFAFKAGFEEGVEGEFARQEFDGDRAFHDRVVGEVDDSHAAAPDAAFDFVAPDFFRDGHGGILAVLPARCWKGIAGRGIAGGRKRRGLKPPGWGETPGKPGWEQPEPGSPGVVVQPGRLRPGGGMMRRLPAARAPPGCIPRAMPGGASPGDGSAGRGIAGGRKRRGTEAPGAEAARLGGNAR